MRFRPEAKTLFSTALAMSRDSSRGRPDSFSRARAILPLSHTELSSLLSVSTRRETSVELLPFFTFFLTLRAPLSLARLSL